jgi:DNA polymerase III delta prime subunit
LPPCIVQKSWAQFLVNVGLLRSLQSALIGLVESAMKGAAKMFHQTLNLVAKPMIPTGSAKIVNTQRLVALHPDRKGTQATRFEAEIGRRVVGQERAVRKLASLYQIFHAGLTDPARPIGTMLFLGPTGWGKTHVVEASAEVLFGDRNAVIQIDCAEFQHSHELAKLIGSPPGYLGHRETSPLLSQENLYKYRTEQDSISLVLFDEIEKASDAFWQLLLGILDKGTLTLGDNRRVDFTKALVFMASNLGARQMSKLITGSIGFTPTADAKMAADDLDQKIYRTAVEGPVYQRSRIIKCTKLVISGLVAIRPQQANSIMLPDFESPKKLRKYVAKRMDEVNDYNNNPHLQPIESNKSLTVAEFRKTLWKSYVVNKKYKPSTHYSYENLLDRYVEPVIGSNRLKYLGPRDMTDLPDKARGTEIGDKTLLNLYRLLCRFFVVPFDGRPEAGARVRSP